jgi:hypothetical protein
MDKKHVPSSEASQTELGASGGQQSRKPRSRAGSKSKPKEDPTAKHWYGSDADEFDFCDEVPVGQMTLRVRRIDPSDSVKTLS